MPGKRVLIVDDHPVNRKLPAMLLRGQDWICDEASNGLEALDMLAHNRYDAVLLDISMPELSGDEVCRRIRANDHTRDLLVIAYTAHALDDARAAILAAGFDALLTKPINKQGLLDALATVRHQEKNP
jgi:CheY-like chemotaxis protein